MHRNLRVTTRAKSVSNANLALPPGEILDFRRAAEASLRESPLAAGR